jgi:hypothetical protein
MFVEMPLCGTSKRVDIYFHEVNAPRQRNSSKIRILVLVTSCTNAPQAKAAGYTNKVRLRGLKETQGF